MSNRRLRAVFTRIAVLVSAAAPLTGSAQIEPQPESRAFCWTGRPLESCRTFLVAEGNAYALATGSGYDRYGFGGEGVTRSPHLTGHLAWEVGAMANIGPRHAVGAVVLAGADANGERIGLKARYRHWMGRRAALDVSGGVLRARRAEPYAPGEWGGNYHVPVTGLTGDLALGLTDWGSVSLRGDLLWDADGQAATGLYGGLKLGTRPALVATVLPILGALIAVGVASGGV